MKKLGVFVVFFWFMARAIAQPADAYFGGLGDGFSSSDWNNTVQLMTGGVGDGFSSSVYANSNLVMRGRDGDGFAASQFSNSNLVVQGGDGDGFATSGFSNSNLVMHGGDGEGFATETYLYYHIWTGLIGTGWLIAGNWTNNIVPNDSARVRIPSSVPNFPGVNAGTFTIGASTGNFLCRELVIDSGAQLITRVNCITEIYSKLEIKGLMLVKNPVAQTFRLKGGMVIVSNGGELRLANN